MDFMSKQQTRNYQNTCFHRKLRCLKHFSKFYTRFQVKFFRFCPRSSTFGHFKVISTSRKQEMTTFSGSISLWRVLGDSGLIQVLLWCYRGSWSVRGVRKLVEIDRYYDFWAVFVHFHISKVENDYIYWQYKFMETIGRV